SCEGVEYIPNIDKGLLKTKDKDKTKTSLEKVKDDLQNLKSKMQNELKKLNVQRDGILDDIHVFKKRIIATLEELEKKSITDVQDKHKEITDKITSSSKKIDDILKDVSQQLDKLKQFRSNNEAQLFVEIKVGEEKISEGNDCVRQVAAKSMETLVFEVNRRVETCLSEVQTIGKLTVRASDDNVGLKKFSSYKEKKHSDDLPPVPQDRNEPLKCKKCGMTYLNTTFLKMHKVMSGCY
ncbi:uncharacterized protein LOC128551722, partial [Mercenaria mercenaria]|uniref:uncharacterized protein LOC128551722 n=1 Tax=Mercenaria mercenaria TaxID=6596 RepID=UPI00234E7A9C